MKRQVAALCEGATTQEQATETDFLGGRGEASRWGGEQVAIWKCHSHGGAASGTQAWEERRPTQAVPLYIRGLPTKKPEPCHCANEEVGAQRRTGLNQDHMAQLRHLVDSSRSQVSNLGFEMLWMESLPSWLGSGVLGFMCIKGLAPACTLIPCSPPSLQRPAQLSHPAKPFNRFPLAG